MCPEDSTHNTPTQPLLNGSESLFDNELGSDVTFLVGYAPETWRFPGHKTILSAANPVFHAMFHGPMAEQHHNHIVIDDVEVRAFDNLLRFLYKEPVQFQSVTTALTTLYAAHKYICPKLVSLCISYLNSNLDISNVLEILRHVYMYSSESSAPSSANGNSLWAPSAPPADVVFSRGNTPATTPTKLSAITQEQPTSHFPFASKNGFCTSSSEHQQSSMARICSALLHNCLQFIDENADLVLTQEQVEDLDLALMSHILSRHTLAISSELVLFTAILRWSDREIKRQKLEVSSQNKRLVLGEAVGLVRYLTMTSEEFLTGPAKSGILTNEEHTALIALIIGHNSPALPEHLQSKISDMKKSRGKPERKYIPIMAPPHGSVITAESGSPCFKAKSKITKSARLKNKREDRKKRKADKKLKDENGKEKKCGFSCVMEHFFIVLSCLFD